MRGKSVHEVCQVLGALSGTLAVVVAPRGGARAPRAPPAHRVLHVRAHFDYDPEDDVYIPCRELGKLRHVFFIILLFDSHLLFPSKKKSCF